MSEEVGGKSLKTHTGQILRSRDQNPVLPEDESKT
jgi:hypothetical protein